MAAVQMSDSPGSCQQSCQPQQQVPQEHSAWDYADSCAQWNTAQEVAPESGAGAAHEML